MKHIALITIMFLLSASCSKTPQPVIVTPPPPPPTQSRTSIDGDVITFSKTESIDYTSTATGDVSFKLNDGNAKVNDVLTLTTSVNNVSRLSCNADADICSGVFQFSPSYRQLVIKITYVGFMGSSCKYRIVYDAR